MKRATVFVLGLVLWVQTAQASQEGTLPISSFRIESADEPGLGHAVASGTQTQSGLTSLTIEAFGRTFSLTPKQLQQLRGFYANGLQFSQISSGYSSPGGAVYLVLSSGFMRGEPERRFIVFRPDGRVGVGTAP